MRVDCARDGVRLTAALQELLSAAGPRADNPASAAAGGTLFLDAITSLPPMGQRLLFELTSRSPEGMLARWSGRLVVGSREDLATGVAAGWFLEPLYDLLDKLRIQLEPASA